MPQCTPRPTRNALPRQDLEGLRSGWEGRAGVWGDSLQESLVVAAGAAGGWAPPGVCLGCGPPLGRRGPRPQSKLGGRQDQGAGCPPGGSHFLGLEQAGLCLGSIRPAGQLPGPDEALAHKRPRLPQMLFPPGMPEAELDPDVETTATDSLKDASWEKSKAILYQVRRARQGHQGPRTWDVFVGRST